MGEAESALKLGPVVWDTAHDHVALHKLSAVHDQLAVGGVSLALVKCEGLEVDFGVDAIVESAFVLEDLLDNPRGGTSADDEHYIFAG